MNKLVCIFREPRSGSTWLSNKVASVLNREHLFFESIIPQDTTERKAYFENRKQSLEDSNYVLSTHLFYALQHLKHYENILFIRTARKDITEQCISHLYNEYTEWKQPNIESIEDLVKFKSKFMGLIQKDRVKIYMNQKISNMKMWDEFSSNIENRTIWYEDMPNGFDIPELGIHNLSMKSQDITFKMPHNKKQLVSNYDQIDSWVKECLHESN